MAMSPPSPLLSARRISSTYLNETMIVIVQKIRDNTPRMFSGVAGTWPAWKTSLSAYSGLVPMSPYTTPRAPRVSAASLPPDAESDEECTDEAADAPNGAPHKL